MKKKFLISIIFFAFLLSSKLLAQKVETFIGFGLTQLEGYKFKIPEKIQDTEILGSVFGIEEDDYRPQVSKYKGKNGNGEHFWELKLEDFDHTITLLKNGGCKSSAISKKSGGEPVVVYYGKTSIYSNEKDKIYVVTTGEQVTFAHQIGNEVIEELECKQKGKRLVKDFKSTSDITVSVSKPLNFDDKEFKLIFKNNKEEVNMNDNVFKLVK